uniref:Uncharacterized protein n=1 Tax=viral metagenome TaxID=1070528 RepID=A0A6C0ELH0_9ZZZZ
MASTNYWEQLREAWIEAFKDAHMKVPTSSLAQELMRTHNVRTFERLDWESNATLWYRYDLVKWERHQFYRLWCRLREVIEQRVREREAAKRPLPCVQQK